MKKIIVLTVLIFTGCVPRLENLQKPIKVIAVVEEPKRCTATFIGANGELYTEYGSGMCNLTAGQVLELTENPK